MMCGTGMEWGAVAATRRRDVDLKPRTIHAHGGKTRFRDRIVRVTEDWCWPILERHLKLMHPDTPVVTITGRQALRAQLEACERLELPHHTLHDWRHSYAVAALKRRDDPQTVKRQLGHAPNSVLIYRVYGAYLPCIADLPATHSATRRRTGVR